MITQRDIKLLIEAFKEVFATKDELFSLEKKFVQLQTSVDNMSLQLKNYHEEVLIQGGSIKTIKGWISKASIKIQIDDPF